MVDRNTRIRGSQIFDGGVSFDDMDPLTKVGSIGYVLDGGDLSISVGATGDLEIPFSCVIEQVTLLADKTGSIQVDILKSTFANYPTLTSITGASKPTITSALKSQDATLAGWSTTINAGDALRFLVNSNTNITRCLVNLKIKRI